MDIKVREGDYAKMGAICSGEQITFTFDGEKEDSCYVVLSDKNSKEEVRILVPEKYCLGSLRSIAVEGIAPGKFNYYYEINGEVRLDPYARAIEGREVWNDAARANQDYQIWSAFSGTRDLVWGEDTQPEIPKRAMVLYKLHVRGFSMDHGTSSKSEAGTFAAVARKIPYLKSLGVTTLELMPVYEFEEIRIPPKKVKPDYLHWEGEKEDLIKPEEKENEAGEERKVNYWGYGPGNYFAVKASYAKDPRNARREFMDLVHALHENGLECVLEMYFPEGTNHNMILDVLRFWVRVYHVDGFHLLGIDLPATAIAQDVILSRSKIFYTHYDRQAINVDKKYKNLYIYNEEYLYPARKILNHIYGNLDEFINQQRKQDVALGYVNYISNNNGFTLADVFMYNDRHNQDNGEGNEDGNPWNFSSNYGAEGPTRKKYINAIRKRQWRNAILMLFLGQGVPLLWQGDEMCNSQAGNNNAYCQDNPIGWLNWKNQKSHGKEIDFVGRVAQFRKAHSLICCEEPFRFNDYKSVGTPDLSYHGENAWISQLDNGRMSVGLLYNGAYAGEGEAKEDVYVAYNFFSAMSTLAMPKLGKKKKWYLVIDSFDEKEPVKEEPVLCTDQRQIMVRPQSICVLIGK